MSNTIIQMRMLTYRNYDPALFEAEYIKENVRCGRMFIIPGEDKMSGPAVPLDQVCAQVVALSRDDAGVNVSFRFLDTPMGHIISKLELQYLKLVPIGMGTLKDENTVGDDYRLICFSLCPKQGDENEDEGTHGGVQGTSEEEPQPSPSQALADASEGEGTPDS